MTHDIICSPSDPGGGLMLQNWGEVEPEQVMVEAGNPCRLHPTSIVYVYKVFYHLDMLWMGIWVHPYTVTHHVKVMGVNF
jgi:hypothetical protein